MKVTIFILALFLISAHTYDFCEVEDSDVNIYSFSNQIQQLPLYKYIRGFDLEFSTSDTSVVDIYEPYHVISEGKLNLKQGYSIINVDGRENQNEWWTKQVAVVAQGEEKGLAIGIGEFSSTAMPNIKNFQYYNLSDPSYCYKGLILNNDQDVVVDCQKLSNDTDLICVQKTKQGKLNCKSFDSITKTNARQSVIYPIGQQRFLLSAALTDNVPIGFKDQTFITVYLLTEDSVQFNTVIDRRTLGLDSLSIYDLDVIRLAGENFIVISDAANKLILFRFTADGIFGDRIIVPIEGIPRQFDLGPEGTWLIATLDRVIEGSFISAISSLNIIRQYELDQSDNIVVDLQVSYLVVSVRTSKDQLYVFDRKLTELNYLLRQQEILRDTVLYTPTYTSRFFMISSNQKKSKSVSITNGYILISKVDKQSQISVYAKSNDLTCTFNINIKIITDGTAVVQKKQIKSNFRIINGASQRFLINDFFGGFNLQYTVNGSSGDLKPSLEHISKFSQNFEENYLNDNPILTKILAIDSKSYWVAKVFSDVIRFYLCSVNSQKSFCEEIPEQMTSYTDKPRVIGFDFHLGKPTFIWNGDNSCIWIKKFGQEASKNCQETVFNYNQLLVTDQVFVAVDRTMNLITFTDLLPYPTTYFFNRASFSDDQIKLLNGSFYPREIYQSKSNPNKFYIKMPISVATVLFSNGKLEILNVFKISTTYIPDDLWQLIIGKETILVVRSTQIQQYMVLSDETFQLLHTITPKFDMILPGKYSKTTDSAVFADSQSEGSIQILKLNQPLIDSLFYRINKDTALNGIDWDISGSFILTSQTDLYYQYPEPSIVILTSMPDSTNKEQIKLGVTARSLNTGEQKKTQTQIIAINYQFKVVASAESDNGLSLPATTNEVLIPIPLQKYFNGPITDYQLTCPYCSDGNISLIEPIIQVKKINELQNYNAIVELSDHSGAIVAIGSQIKIVNSLGVVAVTYDVDVSGCTALALSGENLIAFYKTSKGQALYHFEVSTSTIQSITLKKKYNVEDRHKFGSPLQIALYIKGIIKRVLVLNSDEVIANKNSFVKVFDLGENSLGYVGQINSRSFGNYLEPIQSIDVNSDHLVLTLGKIGLGYVNLANIDYSKPQQIINLSEQPSLANFTLDDTNYLRALINSAKTNATNIQVLVTTSNSYSYLFALTVKEGIISFGSSLEVYNRNAHQKGLNWAKINQKYVILASYNQTTSLQSLALYKRSSNATKIDFFTTYKFSSTSPFIPKAALIETKQALLLLISTPSAVVLNITGNFYLEATYETPGDFTNITIKASNDLSSATRDLSIEFEHDDGDGGMKWYIILIIVLLVVLAVGVGFGVFKKIQQKKKQSKKVSLFTEHEEIESAKI